MRGRRLRTLDAPANRFIVYAVREEGGAASLRLGPSGCVDVEERGHPRRLAIGYRQRAIKTPRVQGGGMQCGESPQESGNSREQVKIAGLSSCQSGKHGLGQRRHQLVL